jgi:hypothetical protein
MRIVQCSIVWGLLGLLAGPTGVDGAQPAKIKLGKVDLSKAGQIDNGKDMKGPWKLTIQAPPGATVKRVGLAGMDGPVGEGVLVSEASSKFTIAIHAAKGNTMIADKKKEWAKAKDTKKLVIDEEDTLVREITSLIDKKPAYQFIKYKKVGDREYTLEGGGTLGSSKALYDIELKSADSLATKK